MEQQRNFDERLGQQKDENDQLQHENSMLQEKLDRMLLVMRKAAMAPDNESDHEYDTYVEGLIHENEGLKEILNISRQINDAVPEVSK